MKPTPYKIHKVMRQLSTGSTKPYACTIKAILKCDCVEAPHGVYNELVAVRLAKPFTFPLPTA